MGTIKCLLIIEDDFRIPALALVGRRVFRVLLHYGYLDKPHVPLELSRISMAECGWGRFINMASVNGSKGRFGQTNYLAALSLFIKAPGTRAAYDQTE